MLSPSDKTHPVCFFFASAYFSVSLSVRKSNINSLSHSMWVCVLAHQTPRTHYRIRLLIHMYRRQLIMRFFIPYTHTHNTHSDRVVQQWARLGTREHVYGVLRRKSFCPNQRARGKREGVRERERVGLKGNLWNIGFVWQWLLCNQGNPGTHGWFCGKPKHCLILQPLKYQKITLF